MVKYIIPIIAVLLLSAMAAGHLAEGEDKEVGDYVVDFGYSPEEPRAGKSVALSFSLLESGSQVSPDNLWIRIDGNETLFAGKISPEDTGTFLWKQSFPKEGDYEITARFSDNGTELVETDFSISISSAGDDPLERYHWGSWIFYGEIALIIVLILTIVILSKKSK